MPDATAESILSDLSHVLSLSRRMTLLDETGIPALQELMAERAICIARLADLDLTTMTGKDRERLDDLLSEIQAADTSLEARWVKIQEAQMAEMRQLNNLHGVLGHYRSEAEPSRIGVENQG